jgi:hypothetical protein
MLRCVIPAIVNRGTGAGGAATNATGLAYEVLTELDDMYTSVRGVLTFNGYNKKFKKFKKAELFKQVRRDTSVRSMHGCKQPDESFLNIDESKLFIIEKKFQQSTGSVCEKIQTGDAKRYNYQKIFPDLEVHYMYCLSDWFKTNCKAELDYLYECSIPVFWGGDAAYKIKIVSYINNA